MEKNKKTRILYIITKSSFGGAQKNVFDLATNLPKEKFDAAVAMGGEGVLNDKLRAAGVLTLQIEGLQRDIKARNDLKAFISIFKIIRKCKPDIVHLHSPKAGGLGAFASRISNIFFRTKINIIYTSHGWTFNEERSSIERNLIKIFSWMIITLSHKTIALGQNEKSQVEKWPFVMKKIFVIPIGITRIDFIPKKEARNYLSEKISKTISEETLLIGTIAELHNNKGLQYAIEAMKGLLNPFIYLILGEGEERVNLQKLIEKLDLQEKVFLIGQVEGAAKFIQAFDIFVLSSIKEGLPYTILEAGLAKVPLIATNVGEIPSIVKSSEGGLLIKPKNPKELRLAIEYAELHKPELEEMSGKLYKDISSIYNLDAMLLKTIDLY